MCFKEGNRSIYPAKYLRWVILESVRVGHLRPLVTDKCGFQWSESWFTASAREEFENESVDNFYYKEGRKIVKLLPSD